MTIESAVASLLEEEIAISGEVMQGRQLEVTNQENSSFFSFFPFFLFFLFSLTEFFEWRLKQKAISETHNSRSPTHLQREPYQRGTDSISLFWLISSNCNWRSWVRCFWPMLPGKLISAGTWWDSVTFTNLPDGDWSTTLRQTQPSLTFRQWWAWKLEWKSSHQTSALTQNGIVVSATEL